MKKAKHSSMDFQNDDLEDDFNTPLKWFEHNIADDPKNFGTVTEQVLIELKDEAKKCYDSEVANYKIKNAKTNSNYQWMKTVMSKGTVSDKIAAHIVAIQDNPLCSLDTLQSLVNMVKAGKKKECTLVIDTLTELFLTDLLTPDKKLKPFHQKPLSALNELTSGNAVTRRKILSTWYFEDQLKELYTSYILALNKIAHDTIDTNKEKAIGAVYKLLAGNPEQEKNLLTYLVNKLGDPSQKVASKTIYSLGQLLFQHPNMQGVVLGEVEKMLFRTNVSSKAQYYGLCFLSQFYLSHESSDIARRLIEVYFSFFKACIKKGEVDSRMMSALLMGVNRAYPYAKLELEKISGHIDTMYRLVHLANFNISIHALSLLYQISGDNSISDRFYSALYKKLADPKLLSTSQQAMLLSLIYKALLKDKEISRIKVFIKRLLQLAVYMQPAFACGVLYLVSQLMGKKENLQAVVLKATSVDRFDDDEEKYHDVKLEEEEEDTKPEVDLEISKPSWYHCENVKSKKECSKYNPENRNPLYAGGDHCAYTELNYLTNHFHPTISLYAKQILEGQIIKYSGDPLKDFTLIRFLDRFVFKNPKKIEVGGAHPTFGKRKIYAAKGLKSLPVNSYGYLNENQSKIPVDELFMYTYLQRKHGDKQERDDDDDDDDSDVDSVKSEEFEEMLDKMAGTKQDENLDFLNDIGTNLKEKETRKKAKDEVSEEEMSEDDLDMDEEDEDLFDDVDDDDEEIVFDDDDEDAEPTRSKSKKEATSLFASAEEFASLLEDEGSLKVAPGGSNAFSNKDNADLKQIAWEDKRNRWLKGFDKVVKGKQHKESSKKKRVNQGKFGNKMKKVKRM